MNIDKFITSNIKYKLNIYKIVRNNDDIYNFFYNDFYNYFKI